MVEDPEESYVIGGALGRSERSSCGFIRVTTESEEMAHLLELHRPSDRSALHVNERERDLSAA
jgi:hypothetical protein